MPIKDYFVSCPVKKHLGFDCLGCGFQRSIDALLQGNFGDSFRLYPALFPIIILFSYTLLHLIFKFKFGAKVIIWLFAFTSVVMIISYVIKIYSTYFL
ncbi:MAG: DUF2752 domain-containing protein [Chitinophagaceae bacterium]|nr:DUF2752 domain-containing protein [Chitinophagaceae bacterium]